MSEYTPYHERFFAEQIMLNRSQATIDGLASSMSGVRVDLNPHQVDAALFAMKSPLGNGVLLADEVGLGKTIEAGLVLAQYWSERKRHILLIVPASLRMQWRSELDEKFYIDSIIMESASFNKLKKAGTLNPFDLTDRVVVCSYNFAARKSAEIKSIKWDLVIMDEAHRLRNVYKTNNVTGKILREALAGRKKLLLTATPLQNNLMELYGLVSIIDEHVFGDSKTFREMYVSADNSELRNLNLKRRLEPFCKRTLRKQVTEYIRYTNRIALCQEYEPTKEEEELYNGISEYLRMPTAYALPNSQRTLITMVLRKLLASSSFAIAGTLSSLIQKLEAKLAGREEKLDLNDFDTIDEYDEQALEDNDDSDFVEVDREKLEAELARLKQYMEMAKKIKRNSKGENLLTALEKGFDKMSSLGGQKKAVIFTESRRTQQYLLNLLSDNGYEGKIVFLNGVNNDCISKEIYDKWKMRHADDGTISGSRQADMKAAVVEAFKNEANIMIGTEAAAEGINLQFCSIIVNYDLPWNPQRIEQRIGRCHRYGQKNDVVVINFLNLKNAADVRVYELLDQKFRLFSGVFGSSDDVLGSIESGVDFERRIAEIYQKCKDSVEIQQEFDQLQTELSEQINDKMTVARQSILENFDEEVTSRLKNCQTDTVSSLNKFSKWLYYFCKIHGGAKVTELSGGRLRVALSDGDRVYNPDWKSAERQRETFLRKDDSLIRLWLAECHAQTVADGKIIFDYTNSDRNISFFAEHVGLKGTISIDKLGYEGISDDEHLVYSIVTNDGTALDDELVEKLFELKGKVVAGSFLEGAKLLATRKNKMDEQKRLIEEANKKYFLDECEKLDAYSEELKEGLQRDIKEISKKISEMRKTFKANTNLPLNEMLVMKTEITKLEDKRKRMRRDLYDREDEIDAANERLQDEIREKLNGKYAESHIMTIEFEIA